MHKTTTDTHFKSWRGLFVCAVLLLLAGCQPAASDCEVDSDCPDDQICAAGGGLVFSGGVCVAQGQAALDGGADASDAETPDTEPSADADATDSGCVPQSCEEAQTSCGDLINTCGGPALDCGECGAGAYCNDGECSDDPCTPKTCEDLGKSCGTFSNRCGGLVTCGSGECIAHLDAGLAHTCAVFGTGEMYCWGSNDDGQYGSGSFRSSVTPTKVDISSSGLVPTHLGVGSEHSCAIDASGRGWCWGRNGFGQLGVGASPDDLSLANRPQRIDSRNIEGRLVAVDTHLNTTCARTDQGVVHCWGSGGSGQMGRGDNETANPLPAPLQGVSEPLISVAPSACYSCGISADAVICWGDHDEGCSGDGQPNTAVTLHTDYSFDADSQIVGGNWHTCFLDAAGAVSCFNDNRFGQLGIDNSTGESPEPVSVALSGPAEQLAAGATHTCALLDGGEVHCWGENQFGKLGNGDDVDSPSPVRVQLSGPARHISAGVEHTCAVLEAGAVECWGKNEDGQLGDGQSGANTFSSTPVTAQF